MKLTVFMILLRVARPDPGGGGGGSTGFCQTNMGAFLEGITSALGVIALAGIISAILLGIAVRPYIRSVNQASVLNDILQKGFYGLVILILALPAIKWGLSFTPIDPMTKCIPFI